MARHRLTTTQRGYGSDHQKRRAALLPAALGTPCPGPAIGPRSVKCTIIMRDPRLMDLDHSTPLALGGTAGDRIVCRACNRAAGARLARLLRRSRAVAGSTRLTW